MKRILFTWLLALTAILSWAAQQGEKNYTIIVSLDGFRWDYCEAYDTPFLNKMGQNGVKATMLPSFPSKTFPNHYTLATGLYPDHHGIIANSFLVRSTGKVYSIGNKEERVKPKYYGGDPIWLTAKRQGVKTATVYWVGSDVAIKNDHATYWHDYMKKPLLNFQQRVDRVLELLKMPENKRPHFIMCYFEEPDHNGHTCGPITHETRQAMEQLDGLLSNMWQRIQALPHGSQVNLIVTGDHGMTWIDSNRTIPVKKYIKDTWVKEIEGEVPANIYATRPWYVDSIVNAYKGVDHVKVWKKTEIPAYLHYGSNVNVGDVLVLPDVGWLFTDKEVKRGGQHGFDNTCSDMQVGFRAMGPDFKVGYEKRDKFRNVDVYPLLCHLLGVTPSPNDGTLAEVQDMLK